MAKAWRRALSYLAAAHIDLRLALTGKADPELPPLRLLGGIGGGDFRQIGEELATIVVTHGAVGPDARMLDIGCGVGRVAIPLTRYLSSVGRYDGFDVSRGAIRWCVRNITSRYPNFRFTRVAVRSSMYAALGESASTLTFPYSNDMFDCAFAFSLFTHLTYLETRRYIFESARVLRPGGALIATFFILNRTSEERLPTNPAPYHFPISEEPCRLASRNDPAAAVAIQEDALRQLLAEAGLRKTDIRYGRWAGHVDAPTTQDLVICRK